MNRWLRACGFSLCLAAVLALNGGHWLLLQSFAWGRMVLDFSRHDSLGVAITKTFSGRYPCALCLKVRAGLQQQRQADHRALASRPERISDLFWDVRPVAAPPAPAPGVFVSPELSLFYNSFLSSPPKPPPRFSSPAC